MFGPLQENIPYQFKQVKLLIEALTHSSYANEHLEGEGHNERLEFLGDAVLELCISEILFLRFTCSREGLLTSMRSKLVNQETLADIARTLELDKYLRLGKGEESQGGRGRDALLSDAMESLLGAIFLDGGFDAVRQVIEILFADVLPEQGERKRAKDAKSLLQELTQKIFKERPVYTLTRSEGPEHAKVFEVRLDCPDKKIFIAEGSSLKRAEQTAAKMALDYFFQTDQSRPYVNHAFPEKR